MASSVEATFEIPKSSTFTKSARSSRWSTITFSGLRSRWTIPQACAAESAFAICPRIISARSTGSWPSSRTRAARLWPSSCSITKKSEPCSVRPKSVTSTMFSWPIRDAAIASCWKRFTTSSWREYSSWSTFTANCFPRSACSAR